MNWLNYHHLLYFWTVAREGSIARACDRLDLAQPTISGQLRELERAVGAKLFHRMGRNLVLTETGKEVYRYADEIFSLGRELQDMLSGRPVGRSPRLLVGVAGALPKLVTYRILEPALHLPEPLQIVCQEGPPERLLTQLAVHELDVVLADAPVSPVTKVRAFNHLLGECGVSLFGTAELVAARRRGFPQSLNGAPFLLPMEDTSMRRSLDQWFEATGIRPLVRGEFSDSAALKVFGQAGVGIFAAPSAVEDEVRHQYSVRVLGQIESIRERFYVISTERKLRHPAVAAITEVARRQLFA